MVDDLIRCLDQMICLDDLIRCCLNDFQDDLITRFE